VIGQNDPMPNIASVLKDEISRLARKEIKAETAHLHKTVATHRAEIAALKRRLAALERQLKGMTRRVAKSEPAAAAGETNLRFRAKGFATNRQRLGLSAAQMGKLLGVSALSIYNWESGKAAPRKSHLPAIAALRGVGKKEVAEKLAV